MARSYRGIAFPTPSPILASHRCDAYMIRAAQASLPRKTRGNSLNCLPCNAGPRVRVQGNYGPNGQAAGAILALRHSGACLNSGNPSQWRR